MRNLRRRMRRPITAARFREIAGEYRNNFLTVDSVAEHYGLTKSTASRIINLVQYYREKQ